LGGAGVSFETWVFESIEARKARPSLSCRLKRKDEEEKEK
jgi:hypothetical protein